MTFLVAGAKKILKATHKNQSKCRRIDWYLIPVTWKTVKIPFSYTGSEGREGLEPDVWPEAVRGRGYQDSVWQLAGTRACLCEPV